jgi:hypothetical protein
MHKNRIYVPSSRELRNLVLKEMHNVLYVGHPSYQIEIAVVKIQFFWPGMKKGVVDYIGRCMECQGVNVEHRNPVGLLKPLPIPKRKWEVVLVFYYSYYISWADRGSYHHGFQQNPFKTIGPSGKQAGNTVHRVHCAVSPKIVLLVVETLKCLQDGNEWGSRIKLCDLHLLL